MNSERNWQTAQFPVSLRGIARRRRCPRRWTAKGRHILACRSVAGRGRHRGLGRLQGERLGTRAGHRAVPRSAASRRATAPRACRWCLVVAQFRARRRCVPGATLREVLDRQRPPQVVVARYVDADAMTTVPYVMISSAF